VYKKVVIRLRRKGCSFKPSFDIIITYAQKRNKSFALEKLGFFNPTHSDMCVLNFQRLSFWLNRGAQLRNSVKKCISYFLFNNKK